MTLSLSLARWATPIVQQALGGGFDTNFLPGFSVPQPTFSQAVDDDLAQLDGDTAITYTHFTVWLSMSRKMPVCVAWNIDGGKKKSLPRKGISFVKDTRGDLAKYQFGDELYRANPLDRGHVARRDDLVWGTDSEARQANLDSFFFTNMTPQHESFNQSSKDGLWGLLENAILDEVSLAQLRVSLFGGPVLADDDPPYRKAKIPVEFWKIVFFVDADDQNARKARAFLLTQQDLIGNLQALELRDFRWYQVPLATIEQKTGLVFHPSLHAADAPVPQGAANAGVRLVDPKNFRSHFLAPSSAMLA